MTTATRTTKAGPITRTITVSFALAGRCEVCVRETQDNKTTEDGYLLARQPSDFGAAFQIRKCSDEREVYDVLLSRNGHTCTCPWGTYKAQVKPLIEGDAAKGWGPVDLRTAKGFEPMLVTNDLVCGPLQVIDGNHRMIAQFITGKSFDGVPVHVCVHPMMVNWPYVIESARDWFGLRCGGHLSKPADRT